MNEFLHTTDLKDQLLVVNEGGGGKGGGRGGGWERGSVVAKKV